MNLKPETIGAIKQYCVKNNLDYVDQKALEGIFGTAISHPEILAIEDYHKTTPYTKEEAERMADEKYPVPNKIKFGSIESDKQKDNECYIQREAYASALQSMPKQIERFKIPDDKTLVQMAIVVNEGKIEQEKLADMVAMAELIIHRLYENGDALIPSLFENKQPLPSPPKH